MVLIIDLGRLHPLLVHLPIGMLILTFFIEIYERRKNKEANSDMVRFALGIAAISSVAAVGSGWLLGENGGYDQVLLFRHRWMAVALTAGICILYYIKRNPRSWNRKFYIPFFILVLFLLSFTGHMGGSMTHGEDYLFKDAQTKEVIITDVSKAVVFTDIVQPILDNKCASCHNSNKVKGGLIITSKGHLLAGGDSGSILEAKEDEIPRLIRNIKLPLEHEDHMPPKGKTPLTADEISLLEWWINNKNCFDCVVETLDKPEEINTILLSLEEDTSPRALIAKTVDPISTPWLTDININGTIATRVAENNPLIIINLSGHTNLTKEHFKKLKKQADNIIELNLSKSNFNDTLSSYLSQFKNITKLQLHNTTITDNTLKQLARLKHLESLNLYGTHVTNAGIEKLHNHPSLKTLYTWETKISEEALENFERRNPKINIVRIDRKIFAATSLDPPTIIGSDEFFKDSLEVRLDYIFKDADFFYTLDGTTPDTISLKYTKPIIVTNSVQIKAITHKKGWKPSDIASKSFKKYNLDYSDVQLLKEPNDKYKGIGSNTLIDKQRGTLNILDGKWLGYEGSHVTAIINLNKESLVSKISVGSYSSPAQWIFYPRGFKVWSSLDGKSYSLLQNIKTPEEEPNSEAKLKFFDIDIIPTKANFIKVEVLSQLKNPTWHTDPGGNSWLFLDEIVLN